MGTLTLNGSMEVMDGSNAGILVFQSLTDQLDYIKIIFTNIWQCELDASDFFKPFDIKVIEKKITVIVFSFEISRSIIISFNILIFRIKSAEMSE